MREPVDAGVERDAEVGRGLDVCPDAPAERVILVWSPSTALSMPWEVFVSYWSDFCYPSSDDVDVFVEGGPLFLRWHHFEEFEYDADAL